MVEYRGCFRCDGTVAACPLCLGENRFTIRNPARLLRPSSFLVLDAFELFKNAGLVPDGGGWIDMPATLLDAFGLIHLEREGMKRGEPGDPHT